MKWKRRIRRIIKMKLKKETIFSQPPSPLFLQGSAAATGSPPHPGRNLREQTHMKDVHDV
jgi:hypothetical protein